MANARELPRAKYRRAKDLARAGANEDALRLLQEAIGEERVGGDEDPHLFYEMNETLAEWLHPRPEPLPDREWQWPPTAGKNGGGVRTAGRALTWLSQEGTRQLSQMQSSSSFVAFGPPSIAPDDVVRELAALLGAEREPWFLQREEQRRLDTEAASAPRRVRASDFYQVAASDFGVTVEPTPAKTRDEHLADLRQGASERLRIDAATALRGFPEDAEVLHALAEACEGEALATVAFTSLVVLLGFPWPVHTVPISLIGTLVCERVGRPAEAHRVGLAWLARFVALRATGDPAPAFTVAVGDGQGMTLEILRTLPEPQRFWAGLLLLVRARTDDEVARTLADFPECDP